jgi:NADH-quinone oxidoreductase subunit L
MYQAIVFLPLLGAIIAGAIAIVGARRRHPGGEPGTQDHAHETHFGLAAHDDHDEGDHEPAEGSQAAEIITSGFLVVAAVLSWIAFFSVAFETPMEELPLHIRLFNWFSSQTLEVDWALRVDTLTVVMLVVVTTVSALVHIYSIGYMAHDPHRPRFFAYLSVFTFAMLALVTADNLVQLYFGWEGVGLASYLLIGFWWQRPAANAAAIKAFIVNRVGDVGFALGIFAAFVLFNSVDYDTIFANGPTFVGKTFHFLSWNLDALTVVCLLLFMGAMGKSAQFLLHTWLPDAMEGPTPVSALIHAATMVTAGVFMVARLSPIFALSPTALAVVMFFGATTAFFAATVGLVQNDIKRVVAYSTCSQLGYMFVAMGAGAFGSGMFHLFTHAFFKALLFLGAGSVIHAVGGEQDMRKMGGLRTRIPVTYWLMVIGTLSLTGFPFTAGYFSKDAIIEAAYGALNPVASYAWVLTVSAALMTSFYSWRLIFLTFHGPERETPEVLEHVHESPPVVLVPLYVLAAGSLLAGLAFVTFFIGAGTEEFWKGALVVAKEAAAQPVLIVLLPSVMMAAGFAIALWFYVYDPRVPAALAERNAWLYRFLLNKWYFDELYDFLFVRPALWLARFLWKRGDGWLIDGFGPDGVSARVLDVTQRVVRLQSGYLYHYAFAMLIGVALLVTWLMFHG